MPLLKLLLLPFAVVYKAITDFRNHLYNIGSRPSVQFDRFVISVGNLTVGGTGKTPFVELLIRHLMPDHKLAVLSRGYGRKTSGFRLAEAADNAITLGDEPFQYQAKFGKHITVAVGEDRAMAIPEILFREEDVELFILDDAYQHRRVRPDLNILLNDFHRPFYKDRVMPAGLLRESRKHASRADVVVVTKCPEQMNESDMRHIQLEIQRYTGSGTPVFFSGIRYLEPKSIYGTSKMTKQVFLFSGIANHEPFEQYVKMQYRLLDHKKFPDHYTYNTSDLRQLARRFDQIEQADKCLLTTEKDMVRLLSMNEQFLQSYPVFYLPIELYFLKNEDSFARILASKIAGKNGDRGSKS
jgi:tetraacyldisaccharide 4'-kinase